MIQFKEIKNSEVKVTKRRFIDTRKQSFFGNYIYDQVIPKDHFLRLLNEIIDWDRFTDEMVELYGGGAEFGRPPFDPSQMLKICLLAYLYELSERRLKCLSMRTCLRNILWA